MKNQNKPIPFKIINERDYIWKTPSKIETIESSNGRCPHCSKALLLGFTFIPIGNGRKAQILGRECKKCGVLFVTRSDEIRNLLQDNKNACITLDGESLWNYSFLRMQEIRKKKMIEQLHEKSDIMARIDGSVMLAVLEGDSGRVDCVITNNPKKQIAHDVIITHYLSLSAREIITSVYHSPCDVEFNGEKYKVIKHYYPLDSTGRKQVFPPELMPSDIQIKAGGGYYNSIMSNHDEIVDILMYSLATRRYEVVRATYNQLEGKCYMDIGIFRSYVQKYGRPQIQLLPGASISYGTSFEELKAESMLHVYGYSVSKSDGLTEAERHELLAEIVDLELLSVSRIVNLLEFFIKTHTSDKYYYARDKWKKDMKFIEDYKVNPGRFLIVR